MKKNVLFLVLCLFVNCLCFSGPAKDRWSAKLNELRHFRNVEMKQFMDLMESWYHNLSTDDYNRKMDSRDTQDRIQRFHNRAEVLQRELAKCEVEMNKEKIKELEDNIYKVEQGLFRDLSKNINKGSNEARRTEMMLSLGMGMGSYTAHMQHVTDKDYLEFHSAKIKEFIAACFVGDEKIQTESGDVLIKDIKEGDYVKSCDLKEDKCVFKKVTKVGKRLVPMSDLVELTLTNGDVTTVTKNHMIYVKGLGYVDAEYLKKQDELIAVEDKLFVENVEKLTGDNLVYVYSIEVEGSDYDNKNHFVNDFLAHNCSGVVDCYGGVVDIGKLVANKTLSLFGLKDIFDTSNSCEEAYDKLKKFFDA